jgi:Amt family ammonium transporter
LLDAQEEIDEMRKRFEIKVKEKTRELEELNKALEEKVKERTKELQEKTIELQKRVAELEEFHRLAVGRELKMIELKEEIKRLKKELEKYKGQNS